ncbi:ion channel-forming bestrophin family protein, partial [Tremellales sp. Uapishka_1]
MSLPLNTLSSLLTMQDKENDKPRLSKISWLPDILVFRSSIIPTVLGPVLTVTLFSVGVALAALYWGKEIGLTNNVVPLLSVVVGLLLVFRNSSAYERYAEGRKDFTNLVSNARNLSRASTPSAVLSPVNVVQLVWISVSLPPSLPPGTLAPQRAISREELTAEKKRLIRLVVAFVVATKHHLRAEGGVHHDDLQGLLPRKMLGRNRQLHQTSAPDLRGGPLPMSPASDEESTVGLSPARPSTPRSRWSLRRKKGEGIKRRPAAVRVVSAEEMRPNRKQDMLITERTPLIKPGVTPDLRKAGTGDGPKEMARRAELGLGRMIELGLPLIIAHEISRTIFKFRKAGYLETVGPAVTVVAFTLMGVEGIAAEIEMPFGTDPSDLNLDLYCTELLCECEAILERLPEGEDSEGEVVFERSRAQQGIDDGDDDDDGF